MDNLDSAAPSVGDRSLIVLAKGESGIVRQVLVAAEDYTRLAALGLCPGRRVEVLQTGSRIVIRSGQTCLGIHPEIAAAIRVCA